MKNPNFVPAGDLERETGLSSDLLRKWRFRYGFPTPSKQDDGNPTYTREQVTQLRVIKRLLDAGFRPAMIVGKSLADLERLAMAMTDPLCAQPLIPTIETAIKLLQRNAVDELAQFLADDLSERGLTEFVQETAAPLAISLGEAWSQGKIEVYHEHLCTEILKRLLIRALGSTRAKQERPRIIFGTPSEELHILGMLMAESVLADQGAHCISAGAQMPIDQLNKLAHTWQADIVAISFSFAYPARRIRPLLVHLRSQLPETVEIWAGGAGVGNIKRISAGIRLFSDLYEPAEALRTWLPAS